MIKHILILEDLESSRNSLVKMVQECGDELKIYDFGDAAKAYECAMEQTIDLFLVDIVLKPQEINDCSGITFARSIRDNVRYVSAEIVFITSLAGLEAQLLRSVHCYDYIEKPIFPERVHKVVKEVIHKIDHKVKEDELVFLRKDRITYPIAAKKIIYAESRRKVLYLYTVNEVIDIPNYSLKKLIDKIQTQNFLFPTKGIAINVNYIEYIDSTNRYVKMRDIAEPLEIGSRMKTAFMKKIYELEGVKKI